MIRDGMGYIGINAQLLTFSRSYRNAGSAAYIYQLLRRLPELGSAHRFMIFTNAARDQISARVQPGFRYVRSRLDTERPAKRILWEQTALPYHIAARKLDLIHGTLNVLPLARRIPGVVTIHDVSFLLFPERFLPAKRRYLSAFTRWSARGAAKVMVSSNNTRNDVIRLLGVPEERVQVVYLGVEERLREPVDPQAVDALRAAHSLPDQFFLYIGTLEPRKNLVRLVEAYAQARRAGVEWPLVLAGGKGWLYEEIFERVQALGLEGHVRFPGYVPYEDLPTWYHAASAFVYPSLYEGFGLPIAEAMACGCPVLTARNSSLTEVAGDAAILVDGEDMQGLAHGLIRLAGDAEVRRDLSARGIEQSRQFTWVRTASETLAVYDAALQEG